MTLDLKGIYQYQESDAEPSFSELLNLGMQSVSDALSYLSGPAVKRDLLSPAPEGVVWQDTDGSAKRYIGRDGAWAEYPPGAKLTGNTLVGSSLPTVPHLRIAAGSNVVTSDSNGYAEINVAAGTFPNAILTYVGMNGDRAASANIVHGRQGSTLSKLLFLMHTPAGGVPASVPMRVNWLAIGC